MAKTKTKTKLTPEEQERIKKLEDMMNAPVTEAAVLESKRKVCVLFVSLK